jgi:DNA-binding transcriptional ArsR family regulator
VDTYIIERQLNALGEETRRAILTHLLSGPMPVGKLAEDFPVSRPAISQHLKILKDAHLVTDRAEGNRRMYQLNPEGWTSLRNYLDQFWTHAMNEFVKRVEQSSKEER